MDTKWELNVGDKVQLEWGFGEDMTGVEKHRWRDNSRCDEYFVVYRVLEKDEESEPGDSMYKNNTHVIEGVGSGFFTHCHYGRLTLYKSKVGKKESYKEQTNRKEAETKWERLEEEISSIRHRVTTKCGYCMIYEMDCGRCPLSKGGEQAFCDARALNKTKVGEVNELLKTVKRLCTEMAVGIHENRKKKGDFDTKRTKKAADVRW